MDNHENIHISTDGSKCETDTEEGFFCDLVDIFKLDDHNSVFQAEIVGIAEDIKWATVLKRKSTNFWSIKEHLRSWNSFSVKRTTKSLWGSVVSKQTRVLLGLR